MNENIEDIEREFPIYSQGKLTKPQFISVRKRQQNLCAKSKCFSEQTACSSCEFSPDRCVEFAKKRGLLK